MNNSYNSYYYLIRKQNNGNGVEFIPLTNVNDFIDDALKYLSLSSDEINKTDIDVLIKKMDGDGCLYKVYDENDVNQVKCFIETASDIDQNKGRKISEDLVRCFSFEISKKLGLEPSKDDVINSASNVLKNGFKNIPFNVMSESEVIEVLKIANQNNVIEDDYDIPF